MVYNAERNLILEPEQETKTKKGAKRVEGLYEHRDIRLFIGGMTHYPVPVHVHEAAEIVSVTRGRADIRIDGVPYSLRPGDVAVCFPLTPHSYEALSEDIDGIAAIFPTDLIPEYQATFHSLIPEEPVWPRESAGRDVRDAVRRLSELNMDTDLPLCVAYLHVLLGAVLHRLNYRPVYDYSAQDLGYKILQYVSGHACEEITLESVAYALGISASHLSHFFAEKLHIRFRRYINSIRIEKARLMMRNPEMTMTMISDACGYSSIRTFRRAFESEVGMLPSDHMRSIRQAGQA